MEKAVLVLETGETFAGQWWGGSPQAGEVVFNTSHGGYEEMATDPSYYSQILVTTAPMQGNYGADQKVWESKSYHIRGFVCLELQDSSRDRSWVESLTERTVPVVSGIDTRRLVLRLREGGTTWGALVPLSAGDDPLSVAKPLIEKAKLSDRDWAFAVSRKEIECLKGEVAKGPRVAVLDFGCKENILRELKKRSSEVGIFPSRSSAEEIRKWSPDGILLSNGPGDPGDVQQATETVKSLLGWRFVFGICMGHQILARALGAKTYKLKFGHRGGNHPIDDRVLNKVYVTSQNHGYAVSAESLPDGVEVTHVNLNDNTVSGIRSTEKKCMSVQFHPESRPGPHDAEVLFDYFTKSLQ